MICDRPAEVEDRARRSRACRAGSMMSSVSRDDFPALAGVSVAGVVGFCRDIQSPTPSRRRSLILRGDHSSVFQVVPLLCPGQTQRTP